MDGKIGKKVIVSTIAFVVAIILIMIIFSRPIGQEGFDVEVLATNLDTPWAMDFLPDGRLIFTERPGRVNILEGKNLKKIADITEVSEKSESGLHGIAVDPDFNNNKYIYLYYTHETANRVSRFTLDNNQLIDETILLDNIPSARFHDGGRIKFGPDGLLYIATGDATEPSTSQQIDSLAGKILRMNKDGTIPSDNPFNNYVYSYGHRNPQGLTWAENGRMYAAEHGESKNDEINLIIKGTNYGWPNECTETGEFTNPVRCFTEFTLAPSGIAYANGKIYVAGLRGTQLRKLVLSEDGQSIVSEEELFAELGRIRSVVEHKGYLYIATSNKDGRGIPRLGDDKIIRVKSE